MPTLFDKAWSPYVAGVLIGLLQIPAFLLIETALGASSSYVTVGDAIANWFDPSLSRIEYVAKHLAANAKNLWQVALVTGIAIGAFMSMRLSGARGDSRSRRYGAVRWAQRLHHCATAWPSSQDS